MIRKNSAIFIKIKRAMTEIAMVITPVMWLKSMLSKNKSSLLMIALKLTLLKKVMRTIGIAMSARTKE